MRAGPSSFRRARSTAPWATAIPLCHMVNSVIQDGEFFYVRYFGTKQLNLSSLKLGNLSKCRRQILRQGGRRGEAPNEDDFLARGQVSERKDQRLWPLHHDVDLPSRQGLYPWQV